MTTKNEYSSEERMLAALAHGSVIASGIGFIVGILIYITQKEKSVYAARQALQAAVYQLFSLVVIIGSWILWTVFYLLTFIPLINNPDQYSDAPPPIFWVGLISMVCPFLIMLAFWLYGFYAAIRTWSGAEFRYALIGKMVEERI